MHFLSSLFTGAYLLLIFLVSLYGLHRCWILYLYFRYYKLASPKQTPALQSTLPHVTIQLPIYNERYVIERLIDRVCQLDYPRERLEIQILDDSTDDTREIVARKVQGLRAHGVQIVHLHRMNRTGYKAGALEAGLM